MLAIVSNTILKQHAALNMSYQTYKNMSCLIKLNLKSDEHSKFFQNTKRTYCRNLTKSKQKITAVMITHDVDEAIFLVDRVVMMTSRPKAKIGDILNIDFERHRTRKLVLEHDDYYKYRKRLFDFLEH